MPRDPDVDEGGARGWGAFVAATYVIVALLLGSNLPNPLFPSYAESYGLSPLDITLIFATYTLLVIPALIFFAPLSDARGRRQLLVTSIVVAAVAAGIFAAARGAAWLYAAEAVQALALGALQGTAAPALVEHDPRGDVRRAAAIASAATLGGAAAGPVLAGVLAEHAPLSPRLPYVVEIGLLVVALVAVLRLPEPARRAPWRPRWPQVPERIRRPFAVAGLGAFVGWSVTGLFLALIPSFVTTLLHRDLVFAGLVLALMLACSAVVAGVAHQLPSLPMQLAGIGLLGVGVVVLFGAVSATSLGLLLAGTVVAGVGQGLTFMGSLADVNEIAPADQKANVVASYYVVVYLGTALPVVGVGALAGPYGLVTAIKVFAVVVFAVCVVGVVALQRERRRPPAQVASRELRVRTAP